MLSVMKGVKGASPLVSVNNTSNREFKACIVSSSPNSPFRRFLLNRMYQFVVLSIRSRRRGTTVYRRYALDSQRVTL